MKKSIQIAAIAIVLVVLFLVALPFLFDANRFRPTLETDLTAALGRKTTIGNIHLALLSGGVTIDDVSIADDPAFGTAPFLQTKQLTAGVALIPLLFSKQLEVSSFTVTNPAVSLLRTTAGKWNFSTLASGGSKTPASPSSSQTAFSVQKLKIDNGTITVGTIGPGGKTQTYQNVTLEATSLSLTAAFPFQLSAQTPGSGKVTLTGNLGPFDAKDGSLTPLDAKIGVENLDLASTGFVSPGAGLGGLIDFNGTLVSDGKQLTSKGSLKAQKLKLASNGASASVPVSVDYDTAYDLKAQTGTLTQGDVHVGGALSHLSGTYYAASTDATIQMKLAGQGMSVPDLEGVLPAVGVTLPAGATLKSGTLSANLALMGPMDKLLISGPINLSNAKLAGFDLKQKLGALSSFTGIGGSGGPDTEIQTLSANLAVDPSGTHAQNINLVVSGVGTITGNANVGPGGQLNCKMVANLTMSGGAGSVLSTISTFTGGKSKVGSGGIPFTVTGTTAHPVFVPDVAGALGGLAKTRATNAGGAADAAAGVLGSLFGKKK